MTQSPLAHIDELRVEARALPESPGVYFWKDGRGRTLYIGKAVNLRARVSSYFSNAKRDRRTRELLTRARLIQHELAGTELEALIKESALIKQEQPPFNRALRTSRRLFYLKFDARTADPYMEAAREVEDDGSLYFGPFRSITVLRETMAFLHDVLPLRKCTAMNPRCRPCIYFQMDKCAAPPLGGQFRQRHVEAIERLSDLLDGRSDRVISWLEGKRDLLSDNLMFERAAEVQGRLDALHELLRRQTMLEAAVACRCVLINDADGAARGARLLLVAHGSVLSSRSEPELSCEIVLAWIRAHAPVARAAERLEERLDAAAVLERWLVGKRDRVRWVAVPYDAAEADLLDRIAYVLAASVPDCAPAGVS